MTHDAPAPALSKATLFLFALCAGGAVANLYYAQPLLALIGQSFNASASVGLVSTATQLGYMLGIFLIPVFFVVVNRLFNRGQEATEPYASSDAQEPAGTPSSHIVPTPKGA